MNRTAQGFTLVEMVIYVGILSILLIAIFNFAWVAQTSQFQFYARSIQHQGVARVLNTIDFLVKNADGFVQDSSGNNCFSSTTLRLYFATSSTSYLPPGCMGSYASGAIGIEAATSTADWYDGQWLYRKKITIDNSLVYSDEQNFPVLATTTDATFANKMSSDAHDVVFTASDGRSKLPHEIESYASSTGVLVAWVGANVSASTDTVLYMYYGNGDVTDQQNTTDLWPTSEYMGVWHMAETASSTLSIKDSSANGNDGTPLSPVSTNGHIGRALDFGYDDIDDRIEMAGAGFPDSLTALTIEYWADGVTTGVNSWPMGRRFAWQTKNNSSSCYTPQLSVSGGGGYMQTSSNCVRTSPWHVHQVHTWQSSGTGGIFLDGISQSVINNLVAMTITQNGYDGYIGLNAPTGNAYKGYLDEVRWHTVVRSDEWIHTSYETQQAVNEFLTFGDEETNGIQLICYRDYPNQGKAATCDLDPPNSGVVRVPWYSTKSLFVGLGDVRFATTTAGSRNAIETRLNMGYIGNEVNFSTPTVTSSSTAAFRQ